MDNNISINNASKLLAKELFGKVPHVVGVSVGRGDPNLPIMQLFVDIDSIDVFDIIPREYLGYDVNIRLVRTPKFASN